MARLLAVAAVLGLPTVLAVALAMALGAVGIGGAVLVVLVSVALTAALARPFLADHLALTAHLRALAHDADAPAPAARAPRIAGEPFAAVAELRRAWRRREDESTAALASWNVVFDSLPDPVLMLDARRRVTRANVAGRRLFGRDPAGHDLAAALREPKLLEAADAVIGGKAGATVAVTLPGPAERDFQAGLERLPRPVADGSAAILALHDVTAARRMERMRADFVANASHELRTPLSTLLGFIETLRGPARDDAEARERFLAIMHEQAARMARLVADLLSLSRIELNEHTAPGGRVDLRRTLTGVAETLEMQLRERDMTLRLDMPDDLPPVAGDADELAQVFQNLIDNARKYGRANTAIEVSARRVAAVPGAGPGRLEGGAVSVAVRDHGEGIAREHLPRLTERFFRVDDARSRKLGGTGLGLAIVKHVVNRHRGLLAIDSTPGEGSVFTVYLPPADTEV